MQYTREDLIQICEKAIVSHEFWSNRDTADSQQRIGEAWALLKANCPFKIRTEPKDADCVTDDNIIWMDILFNGFAGIRTELFYLPTLKRLEERKGMDWY